MDIEGRLVRRPWDDVDLLTPKLDHDGLNPAAIFNSLHECGVSVRQWQVVDMTPLGRPGKALRLVATRVQ